MSRDPIGYEDGFNLFQFLGGAPGQRVDPLGTQYVEPQKPNKQCQKILDKFLGNPKHPVRTALDEIQGKSKPLNCNINIFCGSCGTTFKGDPVGGQTVVKNGRVHICISDRLQQGEMDEAEFVRRMEALLLHELAHAKQFCGKGNCPKRPYQGDNPEMGNFERPKVPKSQLTNLCRECERNETAAYSAQASYLYPNNTKADKAKRDAFVKAGVCHSCAHVCVKFDANDCPSMFPTKR